MLLLRALPGMPTSSTTVHWSSDLSVVSLRMCLRSYRVTEELPASSGSFQVTVSVPWPGVTSSISGLVGT